MAKSTPGKYAVRLSPKQRGQLEQIRTCGRSSAKAIRRANVLLLSDRNREGGRLTRTQIAEQFGLHPITVDKIRKQFALAKNAADAAAADAAATVIDPVRQTTERKRPDRPPVEPILDGQKEAQLVAICCSPAPEGRARWTLQMLADELVARKVVTQISDDTVRRCLKKTS